MSAGGTDDFDNLKTSCFSCNRGKSDTSLSVVPKNLDEKASEIAEREEQIRGYQAVMQARRERLEDETWTVFETPLPEKEDDLSVKRDWFNGTKNFVTKLGFDEVLDAMEIAVARKPWSKSAAFKYFCAICWNKIRDSGDNG